jgi:hypothetical protein
VRGGGGGGGGGGEGGGTEKANLREGECIVVAVVVVVGGGGGEGDVPSRARLHVTEGGAKREHGTRDKRVCIHPTDTRVDGVDVCLKRDSGVAGQTGGSFSFSSFLIHHPPTPF